MANVTSYLHIGSVLHLANIAMTYRVSPDNAALQTTQMSKVKLL